MKSIFTCDQSQYWRPKIKWSTPFQFFCRVSLGVFLSIISSFCLTAQTITVDGNPGDWANFRTNGFFPTNAYAQDANNSNDNQFTQGSKDGNDINTWAWSNGQTNNKGDISNAGAILKNVGGQNILYFCGDRAVNNGDAAIGFWFFKNEVGLLGTTSGTFSGLHANGDILVVSHFTQGGGTSELFIYTWLNGGLTAPVMATTAAVNTGTPAVPAGFTYASATYPIGDFFEGSINLTTLNIPPCFANFLLETRNSQSITASLQDLAFGNFTQTIPPPTTVGAARCGTGNVTLTASGCTGGTLRWYDAATGGTLVFTGASYTVSLTATKTFYVSCTTSDGCLSGRAAVTGTVNGNPTVLAGATPAGNVNIGSAPPHYLLSTTVNGTLSNTGFNYSWSQDPPQGPTTGTLSATNIPNPTFTANIAQSFTWTVIAVDKVTGCSGTSPVTRTINPVAACPLVPRNPVCAGTTNTYTADVAPASHETWTWTANNDATVNAIPANGGQSISVTAGAGNFTLTLTKVFANTNLPNQVCNYPVVVNPPGQVNQPDNQTLCNGQTTAVVTFSTTNAGGTTTYAWTNSAPSIGLAASGSGNIAAFTAVNTGTAPVVATITVTPTFTFASVSCVGPAKTFTITVNPTGQVNQPGNQILCNGATTTAVTFSTTNTGGTTTYAWTNSAASIGLAASGTGNIAAFTAVNTGTSPVIATIVVTPTFTNGGIPCAGPTKTFTITVNPTGQVNQPGSQTLCNGATTTAVNFSTNNTDGTTTYAWTNSATSIGLAASGSGNIAAFTAVNTGTSPVVASITVTPTFANAGVSCVGPAKTFTITVNPTGQVNQPGNQTLCNGATTTAVTFSTTNTGGTTTYAWTNSAASIGLAASGTGDLAAFTAVNTGTSPVVATIVVTPTFTNGGVPCAGPTKTFTITVNPTGQVNQPGNQTLCNGATTTAVTFSTTNTGGTTTYAWTNSAASIGLAASGTGNIAAFTAVNTGTSPVVATIVVTPTFTNGGVPCAGPTKTFTITVNPTGQVNQPGNQTLCNGGTTTAVNFSTTNTGGTTTYAWTNSATSIGLAASGTGNIAAFTAVNTGTSPVVATIIVTPTFTNGSVSCPGATKTFTITVNPTGQVNQPGNQTLCNGATTTVVTFSTTNTGGTTTYAWTNSATSIGLAASGSGNIAAFTAVNTGTSAVVATITVTPTFTNGGVSCVGPAKSFTITVNPDAAAPLVTYIPPTCTENTFSVQVTNPQVGSTYQLTQLDGNIVTLPASGGYVSGTLIFTGLHIGQGYSVISTTAAGCRSNPNECGDFNNLIAGKTVNEEAVTDAKTSPSTHNSTKQASVETVRIGLTADAPTVAATPNPFVDKVRFSVSTEISGNGSLEIYNMLGQKVHTLYQGYFDNLTKRTFEYNVPVSQRANLIYLLRIGSKKVSGKLVGVN